jgi:hypothetical protein
MVVHQKYSDSIFHFRGIERPRDPGATLTRHAQGWAAALWSAFGRGLSTNASVTFGVSPQGVPPLQNALKHGHQALVEAKNENCYRCCFALFALRGALNCQHGDSGHNLGSRRSCVGRD